MKKVFLSLLCAVAAWSASAQQTSDRPPFGEGKFYVATSLSGLDLTYSDTEKWKLDLTARGGYLFTDNWMVTGQLQYDWRKHEPNAFLAGAGLRYYIEQNGASWWLESDFLNVWGSNSDKRLTSSSNTFTINQWCGLSDGYSFTLTAHLASDPSVKDTVTVVVKQ